MQTPRPKTPLPQWQLWLFPLTYALHIAEEQWGGEGFHAWSRHVSGSSLTESEVLALNLLAWGLMAAGCVCVKLIPRHFQWLWVSYGTVVILNACSHAIGTLRAEAYSPGLVSALMLWIPLGAATLLLAWKKASGRTLAKGLAIGGLIHLVVSQVALGAGGQSPLFTI